MDKKLLALLILASLSPAEATLTEIPAGLRLLLRDSRSISRFIFQGKVSVNIMQWLILIP